MTKLSAFLITRNEEARLARTLEALAFADQIVVVDSGSTDRTAEIAQRYGAEVHFHRFQGYGPQKVFAEGKCAHDWRLNVDADEVVTPDLAREIRTVIASGRPAAYRMRIRNVYPGEAAPRAWAADYNEVRLYHREVGGYRDHALHDRVETQAEPQQLDGAIHHFPIASWAAFVDKENRYSSYNARRAGARNRTGLRLRLFVQMPASFVKFYLVKGHVMGGWKGFMYALTASFARTLRLAKMLEAAETKPPEA